MVVICLYVVYMYILICVFCGNFYQHYKKNYKDVKLCDLFSVRPLLQNDNLCYGCYKDNNIIRKVFFFFFWLNWGVTNTVKGRTVLIE